MAKVYSPYGRSLGPKIKICVQNYLLNIIHHCLRTIFTHMIRALGPVIFGSKLCQRLYRRLAYWASHDGRGHFGKRPVERRQSKVHLSSTGRGIWFYRAYGSGTWGVCGVIPTFMLIMRTVWVWIFKQTHRVYQNPRDHFRNLGGKGEFGNLKSESGH